MGKKKVRAVLKLELQAGKATPAPPVGTALGPHGINIMEFTKAYNERTAQQAGDVVPALITIFEDRSFSFVLKTPPAVQLLKRAAGVEKGSAKPNRKKVGAVTRPKRAGSRLRRCSSIRFTPRHATFHRSGGGVRRRAVCFGGATRGCARATSGRCSARATT